MALRFGAHAVPRQRKPNPVVAGGALVAQQPGRAAVGDQHHVGGAVAVDVGVGAAAADQRLEQGAAGRLPRHRLEAPRLAAGIPEQLRRLEVALTRMHPGDPRLQVAVAG